MGVKKFKPTTPGQRGMTGYTFEEITKSQPGACPAQPLRKSGGRNMYGRVTVRHRGGGHRRHIRIVDFKREKYGIPARVAAIEYDPNRTARLALLFYADGEKRYIIAPLDLRVGDTVLSGPQAEVRPGNSLPIANIPVGTLVHNVELKEGQRRPAGACCGRRCPAAGERRRLCPDPHALRRSSPGAPDLLCHDWPGRQPGTQQYQAGQGRPQAPPGHPPNGARYGDEPA